MIYLLVFPVLYVAICAVLYFRQDRLLFFPTRAPQPDLNDLAQAHGFSSWTNTRGQRIGWQSATGRGPNVLLVLHGNGGFALDRSYYRDYCQPQANWTVFLLEYPGYGAREGVSSEKTMTAAAVEAIDILGANPARKIWLLGESLGSGVASAAVRLRPASISGIILVTPFNSLVAAASFHYPWLPVALLLRTRLDSETNIRCYPGPVAIVIGEADPVVPPHLGRRLYEAYPGRKRLWSVPQAGHNVTGFLSTHWSEVIDWLTHTPAMEQPRDYVASSPGIT